MMCPRCGEDDLVNEAGCFRCGWQDIVYVRVGSVVVPHTRLEYEALWAGVDREATRAMVAPLEDDDAPRPET